MAVELHRRLAHELQAAHQALELRVDVDHAREREPGVAVGHAERQPGHDLDGDRERLLAERERLVLGVEPERRLVAAGVAEPDEPFAAQVELQPPLGRGPLRGRRDVRVLEQVHARPVGPGGAERERAAVERPVGELQGGALQPAAQLVDADAEPVPALGGGERRQGARLNQTRSSRSATIRAVAPQIRWPPAS